MDTSISTPDPSGHPIISHAEADVRAFGAVTRTDAETLLPLWRHYGELTEREIAAVLNRFPAPSHTPDSVKAFWAHTPASKRKGLHAFAVERTAGDHFVWKCRCGTVIVQDSADIDILRDLIEHAGVSA